MKWELGIVGGMWRKFLGQLERFPKWIKRMRRKWLQAAFADRVNVLVAIASLLVGVMAIVLTVLSLQMAKRQEALAEKQTQIAERQSEIAEKQFRYQEQQLERDADISVTVGYQSTPGLRIFPFNVIIMNKGYVPVPVSSISLRFFVQLPNLQVVCTPSISASRIKPDFYNYWLVMGETPTQFHVFGAAINVNSFTRELDLAALRPYFILDCNVHGSAVDELLKMPDIRLEWSVYTPQRSYTGLGANAVVIPGRQIVSSEFYPSR